MSTHIKKTLRWVLVGLLSSLTGWAGHALAEAMVWEVSKDGNTVYLAGSIHMLKPGDYPLPEAYERAFAAAGHLVLETDMQAVQSPQFAQQLAQKMTLPAGQTLASVLDADVYQQLATFAAERGVSLQMFAHFQPVFVALTLSVMEMQSLGFAEGVDVKYAEKAIAAGKTLTGLETPEQQLGFMLAMTQLDPNAFMRYTLEDMKNLASLMGDVVAAFKTGDADKLHRLSAEPMIEYSRELYDTILTDRNRAWLTEIEQFLQTPETEMVMVGALHLAGPDGLPALLKEKGFSVKRF